MLPLDQCRVLLHEDPSTPPYSDDEVRALRAFLYDLARIELAARDDPQSPGAAEPDAPSPAAPAERPP